ncbi:MAG: hypothetical protein ACYDDS_12650 [Candidatus Sulfotelmatobacter sp.]
MANISRSARTFIFFIIACGLTVLIYAALHIQTPHQARFLTLLAVAAISSRFKLKLPGLNGSMSVNLPFVLIAVAQFSLFEALVIALASTIVQCLSKDYNALKIVQTLFNSSTMAVAAGLAGSVFQGRTPLPSASISGSVFLALAGTTFFLVQTLPVATIISLTEGKAILTVWSGIVHLSFPYYVLSAGVASVATTASHFLGWQVPLVLMPVMCGVYRSYQVYFAGTGNAVRPSSLAKAATAS